MDAGRITMTRLGEFLNESYITVSTVFIETFYLRGSSRYYLRGHHFPLICLDVKRVYDRQTCNRPVDWVVRKPLACEA